MCRFLLKRLGNSVLVVAGVTAAVFFITRMVGDPVRAMLPLSATDQQREQFARSLGLDRPLTKQFQDFVSDLLQFDLGFSLWQRRPTIEIIFEALPRTVVLVTTSVLLAVVVSLVLGTLAALKPGGLVDRAVVTLSLIGLSAPQFWMGLMLIIVFAVTFPIFPTSGADSPLGLVLPAVTVALPQTGRLVMMVRSSMLDILCSPYMSTLELNGLSMRRRVLVHGLRNAATPILTIGAWEYVQGIAGYAVVVETVFAWPGIGYTSVQAIENHDLPLLSAIVLVTAVLVVLINLLVESAYAVIDPRLSLRGGPR